MTENRNAELVAEIERLDRLHADLVAGRSFGCEWFDATEAAWPRIRAALEASHAPVPDDVRVFLSRVVRTIDEWDGPFPHPFAKLVTPSVRAAAGTTPEPKR